MQEFLKPHTPIQERANDKTLINDRKSVVRSTKDSFAFEMAQSNKYSGDDSAVPISQTSTLNDRIFAGD